MPRTRTLLFIRDCETVPTVECRDEVVNVCLDVPVTNVTKIQTQEMTTECTSQQVIFILKNHQSYIISGGEM